MTIERFMDLYIHEYGFVKVGNQGTILSKNKIKMKPSYSNKKGYARIHLGEHMYSVHRLVALAWVKNENPEIFNQVNHINGNKKKNTSDNLEWVTNKQNRRHAVINDLSSAKLQLKDIEKIRELYNTGKYTYYDLSKMFNVCYSTIGYVVRRKSWNYRTEEIRDRVLHVSIPDLDTDVKGNN